jgi:hypothetical protein
VRPLIADAHRQYGNDLLALVGTKLG